MASRGSPCGGFTGGDRDAPRVFQFLQGDTALVDAEAQRLDAETLRAAAADFQPRLAAAERLSGAEAKGVLGLVIREVRLSPGYAMEIDLYQGRASAASLVGKRSDRTSIGVVIRLILRAGGRNTDAAARLSRKRLPQGAGDYLLTSWLEPAER